MTTLDKEVRVIAVKGERGNDGNDGKSSYELAVQEELFSGTLEEWIETFATPENYITRTEFQKVTQAQYDAMEQAGTLVPNCYYLIIDDTTAQDFENLKTNVGTLQGDVSDLQGDVSDLQGSIGKAVRNIPITNNQEIEITETGLYVVTFITATGTYYAPVLCGIYDISLNYIFAGGISGGIQIKYNDGSITHKLTTPPSAYFSDCKLIVKY